MGLLRMVNAARLAPLEQVISALAGDGAANRAAPRLASAAATSGVAGPRAQAAAPVLQRSAALPAAAKRGEKLDAAPMAAPVATAPPSVIAQSASTMDGLEAAQVDALLSAIRDRKKMLASMIEHVTRWELSGGEMRLYFPGERRAVAEMLQARDSMEGLRIIASEVLGQPLRVCVKLDPARTSGAPTGAIASRGRSEMRAKFEQDPVVRAMLERFGGEIKDVRRRDEE